MKKFKSLYVALATSTFILLSGQMSFAKNEAEIQPYLEEGGNLGAAAGVIFGGSIGSSFGMGPVGAGVGGYLGREYGQNLGKSAHEIDTKGTLDNIPIQQYPDYVGGPGS